MDTRGFDLPLAVGHHEAPAPDSLTQARWRTEEAENKLDRLLPTVSRADSLAQVADALKRTRDPTDAAKPGAD